MFKVENYPNSGFNLQRCSTWEIRLGTPFSPPYVTILAINARALAHYKMSQVPLSARFVERSAMLFKGYLSVSCRIESQI